MYLIFGNGLIMSFVIFGIVIILLLIARANVATMLMVLIPLIIGFTLNAKGTNLVELPPWIFYVSMIALGFLFAVTVIIQMLRD